MKKIKLFCKCYIKSLALIMYIILVAILAPLYLLTEALGDFADME